MRWWQITLGGIAVALYAYGLVWGLWIISLAFEAP